MVANICRAAIWSSPIDINELVGCGLVSAMIRSFAAYMAASCADTLGILQWVGKNSTVSQIRVPCVLECRSDNIYNVRVQPRHTTHAGHVGPTFHG